MSTNSIGEMPRFYSAKPCISEWLGGYDGSATRRLRNRFDNTQILQAVLGADERLGLPANHRAEMRELPFQRIDHFERHDGRLERLVPGSIGLGRITFEGHRGNRQRSERSDDKIAI